MPKKWRKIRMTTITFANGSKMEFIDHGDDIPKFEDSGHSEVWYEIPLTEEEYDAAIAKESI